MELIFAFLTRVRFIDVTRVVFFSRRFERHLRGYKPKVPLNHGFRASNLACALSLTLRTVFRKEFQERSKLSVSALYRVIFFGRNFFVFETHMRFLDLANFRPKI